MITLRRLSLWWLLPIILSLGLDSYALHSVVAGDLPSSSSSRKGSKDAAACGGAIGEILQELRAQMEIYKVAAYIVPMTDAHQSEYIADQDKRLEYISKFSGSAGEGIVTTDDAALWTDGRYHAQAEGQLDLNCWKLMKQGLPDVPTKTQWLINTLAPNSTIGVDPTIMTAKDFQARAAALLASGHELVSIAKNLVDDIWINRPTPSKSLLIPLNLTFSGKSSGVKLMEVMEKLKQQSAESMVLTALDDIAWLLNLRGSDISYNPVFFSYILLSPENSYFFVDKDKLGSASIEHLNAENTNLIVRDYDEIFAVLEDIVNATSGSIVTSTSASQAISEIIPANRKKEQNLVAAMKAVKNAVECQNMINAHIRDGLALVQYLHWLNETIDRENVTELLGAAKLTGFREQQDNYRGLSFDVISAVGEHAAMAHYKPSPETDKQITRNEIYLVDSGGHYWDGTTDITRTVHFGTPSDEQKMAYTRVLKGFIAVVTSVFPKNAKANYFDDIARRALWQAGLDYSHGTGHGVGMYLYVHEYPPLINSATTESLQANMFTSNEPGYYKDGDFGIRIEDVIQVVAKTDMENAFSGQGALTFKSITYAPLQTKLMDTNLLTKEEANYVNSYNKAVLDAFAPILLKRRQMDVYKWLEQETRQICSWAK